MYEARRGRQVLSAESDIDEGEESASPSLIIHYDIALENLAQNFAVISRFL